MQKWQFAVVSCDLNDVFRIWEWNNTDKLKSTRITVPEDFEEARKIELIAANLGLEGWELVSVVNNTFYYFKRPIE